MGMILHRISAPEKPKVIKGRARLYKMDQQTFDHLFDEAVDLNIRGRTPQALAAVDHLLTLVHRSIRNRAGDESAILVGRTATGDSSTIVDIRIGRWISDTVRYRMLGRLLSGRLSF
jgi:hypothetical protein